MIASTAYLSVQPTQRIAQGADWEDLVTVQNAAGTAQNLASYTLSFVAEVYAKAVTGTATVTNAAGGQVLISLADAQTSDFPAPAMGVGQLWAEVGSTRTILMTFPILTVAEVKP